MPKKVIKLKQHTPLIHFQSEQKNATLRATELKPKLDRFLIKHVFNNNFKEYKKFLIGYTEQKEEKDYKDKKAFDYKVKITAKGYKQVDINKTKYKSLYVGNIGKENKNKPIKAVMYEEITLEFFSFHKELLEKIEENISRFLAVTNFGTRQNKGFGSFYLKDIKDKKDIIADVNSLYDKFLYIEYDENKSYSDLMQYIYIIYQMMKSGINFRGIYYKSYLFQYMSKKGISNEKRKIKEEFFKKYITVKKDDKRAYYVRGLLGICKFVIFRFKSKEGKDKIYKVDYKSNIDRFKSPITFKIIDNYLIIIPEEIPDEIYGKKFTFSNSGKKIEIKIPSKEQFNLSEFLFAFADYFNNLKIEKSDKNENKNRNKSKNKKNPILEILKCATSKPIVKVGG